MLAWQGIAPRDQATYNALIPGIPELSGIRQRLNSCVEELVMQQDDQRQPLAVAVPLYIYPGDSCWEPLYHVITTYSAVEFHVVVNPANGPGGRVPDTNYIQEVARLNAFKNCKVFGYVHVSWGARKLDLVTRDITTWSHWKDCKEADIHVGGIFVDEAPSDIAELQYMKSVYDHAKKELGKDCMVWTNPGVQINETFYGFADLINSHENTHEGWKQSSNPSYEKSTAMIHSYAGTDEQMREDVDILRKAGYRSILITTGNAYTNFSHFLEPFVSTIAQLNK